LPTTRAFVLQVCPATSWLFDAVDSQEGATLGSPPRKEVRMMARKVIGPLDRDQILLLLSVLKASSEFFQSEKKDKDIIKLRQEITDLFNIIAAEVLFLPDDLVAA
jgi:hypothetical protein